MSSNSISILGAGWLGGALGEHLLQQGWAVKASTTTERRLPELQARGMQPYRIDLNQAVAPETLSDFLSGDVLFISIPPGSRRGAPPEEHLQALQQLEEHLQKGPTTRVIYCSSTGVYPNLNRELTEEDCPPAPEGGHPCLRAEHWLLNLPEVEAISLRFGGLFGNGRSIARYFAGRKEIPNGRAPVNQVHQIDCLGVIESVLEQFSALQNETYNVVADEHPSRQEYYAKRCELLGLEPPEFIDELKDWKLVRNDKLKNRTGYSFKVELFSAPLP